MAWNILIIASDVSTHFTSYLGRNDYRSFTASSVERSLEVIDQNFIDLVLLRWSLFKEETPGMLARLHACEPELPIIIVEADNNAKTAVTAMKLGAAEFLCGGFDLDELLIVIQRMLAASAKSHELVNLQCGQDDDSPYIIGTSVQMREAFAMVARVARADATSVLIVGETGTGKGIIAKAIHRQSTRASGPFLPLACATMPNTLLENEIFGHERYAFTDAKAHKPGLFELAKGGTLFLDEIGELPLEMQVRLLSVLDTRSFFRLGGTKEIKVDARVVLATNRDLEQARKNGTFRSDLFFRLAVVMISLPPLRARSADIPLYVSHFIKLFNRELGYTIKGIAPEVQPLLQAYSWPGNVRELKNAIERAMIFCDGDELQLSDFPPEIVGIAVQPALLSVCWEQWLHAQPSEPTSLHMIVDRVSRKLISDTLESTEYNFAQAAALLKLSKVDQLRYQVRKYGIDPGKEKLLL